MIGASSTGVEHACRRRGSPGPRTVTHDGDRQHPARVRAFAAGTATGSRCGSPCKAPRRGRGGVESRGDELVAVRAQAVQDVRGPHGFGRQEPSVEIGFRRSPRRGTSRGPRSRPRSSMGRSMGRCAAIGTGSAGAARSAPSRRRCPRGAAPAGVDRGDRAGRIESRIGTQSAAFTATATSVPSGDRRVGGRQPIAGRQRGRLDPAGRGSRGPGRAATATAAARRASRRRRPRRHRARRPAGIEVAGGEAVPGPARPAARTSAPRPTAPAPTRTARPDRAGGA